MLKNFFLFIVMIITTINLYGASDSFAKKMGYETSYNKALEKAKVQNKPIMMVISSKTCPWCRKFERQTLKKKMVADTVSKGFIPLALTRDVDKYPKQFNAKVVPTVFFIDPGNEKVFDRSLGYKNKKVYKKVLTKTLKKYKR